MQVYSNPYFDIRNMEGGIESMKEEIIDVVKAIPQGSSKSIYVVIPGKIREKQAIDEKTEFVVILAGNGDIIYRKKEAS